MRLFRVGVVVTSLVAFGMIGCGSSEVVDQPEEATVTEENMEDMAEKMKAMAEGGDTGAEGGDGGGAADTTGTP